MNSNDKQKIVNALINGLRNSFILLDNTLSWVQFKIPRVKRSASNTVHYEIRWSKFKNNQSGHDGKTLFIELHAERLGFADKFRSNKNRLSALKCFFYDSGKSIGFRENRKYDLKKVLDGINGKNQLIQNIIQDIQNFDLNYGKIIQSIAK